MKKPECGFPKGHRLLSFWYDEERLMHIFCTSNSDRFYTFRWDGFSKCWNEIVEISKDEATGYEHH